MTQSIEGSKMLQLPPLSLLSQGLAGTGIILLIGIILFGASTTQYSVPILGFAKPVRDQIGARRNLSKARSDLSDVYDGAIDEMNTRVERNRTFLSVLEIGFFVALLLLSVAALLAFSSAIRVG